MNKKNGTTYEYVIRMNGSLADGCPLVKLGFGSGDRAEKVMAERGAEFIFAVSATRDDDHQLKERFKGLEVKDRGSEIFRLEGDLAEWVEWAQTEPWSAKAINDIRFAYPYPGRWPWTRSSGGPTGGQPSLPGMPDVPLRRKRQARLMAQLSSMSDDYFTPPLYIEAARKTMGGSIDLDPASSAIANSYIRADSIFTIETDGLKHDWRGNVWLNPPYNGTKGAGSFIQKLLCELDAGRVTQAVLCLNQSAMSARWFSPLWKRSNRMLVTHHRPVFQPPGRVTMPLSGNDGTLRKDEDSDPTKSSVFVYIGPNVEAFDEYFGEFGYSITAWRQPSMSDAAFAKAYPEGGWENLV